MNSKITDHLCLKSSGKSLEGHYTLDHYGINSGSTLDLSYCFQIFFRGKNNCERDASLWVTPDTTVNELNTMLKEIGIENCCSITMNGTSLVGNHTLTYYNIHNETILTYSCYSYNNICEGLGWSLTISVKNNISGQRNITLDVMLKDTIKQIKALIYDKEGIPPNQQKLTLAGKVLQDDIIIANYNIQKGSIIVLEKYIPCKIKITVKTSNGKTLQMEMESNDTIDTIKSKILNMDGIYNPYIYQQQKVCSHFVGHVVRSTDITFLIKHLHMHGYKWRHIGTALNFQHGELENIYHSSPKATTQQLLSELLSQWSQWPTADHSEAPTMEKLCDALRCGLVGLGDVAEELQVLGPSLPSREMAIGMDNFWDS